MALVVPTLVEKRGGNPIAICLNTVAVLFLLQVDNQCYEFGLPESLKAECEAKGRVSLSAADRAFLWRTKMMYSITIAFGCPLLLSTGCDGEGVGGIVLLMSMANGAEQTFCRQGTPLERVKRAILSFGKFFAGFAIFWNGMVIGSIRTTHRMEIEHEM